MAVTEIPTAVAQRIAALEQEVELLRQTVIALRESEQKYLSFLDSSPDPIVVYNMQGHVTYINPAFEQTFGWKKKELLDRRIDFVPEESLEETQAALDMMLIGQKAILFDTRRLTKDRQLLDVQLSSSLFTDHQGLPAGNIVTLRDIGQRKSAERELMRERKLFLNGPVVAFKWTADDHASVIYVSPNVIRFGYEAQRFVSGEIDYLEIVHPDDFERFIAERKLHLESREGHYDHIYRIINHSGEVRWVYDFTIIIRDAQQQNLHYDSYILDITDRRQAEDALRESEKRLAEIVRGSSIPTFVIDIDHRITHYNKACERLTGISASEAIGARKQWMAFYASERPVLADFIVDQLPETEITRYYSDKYRKSNVLDGAYEAEDFFPTLGPDGKWLFFTAAPLKDADGKITGAIETLQDITERKKAEAGIIESQRRHRRLLDFIPYPVVVMNMNGKVTYLNDAFKSVFGWTLEELRGKLVPFIPKGMEAETRKLIKGFLETEIVNRLETRRLTKDGRVLDVVLKAAVYPGLNQEPGGELVIFRDITAEKRMARHNEAILRISLALPYYPELEELMDYISTEIKRLLNTEGALVLLLDEQTNDFFIAGAAYDDAGLQERAKGLHFKIHEIAAGQVIETGEPLMVNDIVEEKKQYPERDKKFGYDTLNYMLVPLKSSDRIIGVLGVLNKKEGMFDKIGIELLSMISGTVALSIENARFADELRTAYTEVRSLNRAKDKAMHHLSHELKTPVSILNGSLQILEKKLSVASRHNVAGTIDRIRRNLKRLAEIQDEVDDIIRHSDYHTRQKLSVEIDQHLDLLLTFLVEELGDNHALVERIKRKTADLFGKHTVSAESLNLSQFVQNRLQCLEPQFSSRRTLNIVCRLEAQQSILMPPEYLQKSVDGIIRNAIENTPDGGTIEIATNSNSVVRLSISDFGVGIPEEAQKRIFDGFFTNRGAQNYSSGRPFDFNAGGKGADLLRIKIFSERYGFILKMESVRCRHIPKETDVCPGDITRCRFCQTPEDCLNSGGTVFHLIFPAIASHDHQKETSDSP